METTCFALHGRDDDSPIDRDKLTSPKDLNKEIHGVYNLSAFFGGQKSHVFFFSETAVTSLRAAFLGRDENAKVARLAQIHSRELSTCLPLEVLSAICEVVFLKIFWHTMAVQEEKKKTTARFPQRT